MRFLLTLGALIFMATPAFAAAPPKSTPAQVTVTLAPVRGSGQHGTAILTQRGNKLVINMRMNIAQGSKMQENGSPMLVNSAPLGAHIHRGSCPTPQKQPLYPLNPVSHGTSTTTLTNTSLNTLTSGDYTISVHKSAHDTKNPIACGDIKLANPTGTTQ